MKEKSKIKMAEEKGAEVDKEDVYLSVSPDDG